MDHRIHCVSRFCGVGTEMVEDYKSANNQIVIAQCFIVGGGWGGLRKDEGDSEAVKKHRRNPVGASRFSFPYPY